MFDLASGFMGQQNAIAMLPEMVLTIGVLAVLGLTIMTPKKASAENNAIMVVSLLFVACALFALGWVFKQDLLMTPQTGMFNALVFDRFGYLIRVLLLLGAGISIAISHKYLEQNTRVVGDFYILILGATLGGMFLASATDLVLVFVALETLSITSYVLAGYFRKTARSAEASLKYLIYGGMGSAVLLFGLSLVYGLAGSTNFQDIATAMMHLQGVAHPTLIVIMLMVFATFAFKLSTAPFHMWTPDVYEGAPTPVSAFLSVVSKTAAFAVAIRVLVTLLSGVGQWPILLGILAVLSMTIGNFVALKQRNIKRLLAYSTIAHAGYMLLGLLVGTTAGIGSILFYLMTYAFMNLGAFASVIYFNNLTRTDNIEAYSGLVHKRPGLALMFSICLLSLAGIPITSGFFAKFFLFQTVALSGPMYLWLVVIALLNSTVSLAYYLNIIRLMVVKEPSAAVSAIRPGTAMPLALSTALTLCVLVTLLLGIKADPFFEFSKSAADQLLSEKFHMVSQR